MGLNRSRTVAAVVAVTALLLVALVPSADAAPHRLRLSLDRLTTGVFITEAPFGDPEPVPAINAYGTIRGCVPGSLVQATVEITQDGAELDDIGALGAGEFVCSAAGTVRVGTFRWKYGDSSVPHAGRARARLVVFDAYGPGTIATVSRWVVIPR